MDSNVYQALEGGITATPGFIAGGTYCGIKTPGPGKLDLGVLIAEGECSVAGTVTQNTNAAAPVLLSRERLKGQRGRGAVFNSGNANACTGPEGVADARAMTAMAGERFGVPAESLFVGSTGVIGVRLPMEKIRAGFDQLKASRDGGPDAAASILTTDTRRKEIAIGFQLGGRRVTMAGIAKGSAMMHPNMATMLCFITTDAAVEAGVLQACASASVARSFNMITIDRDTSTNDTVLVFANGAAGNPAITSGSADLAPFQAALDHVMIYLAKAIARDGEGASKFMEVTVEGAGTLADARKAAREIASSVLMKTAMLGADPNWGRVMMALGNSGASFDPLRVDVFLGEVQVAKGGLATQFSECAASAALAGPDVSIRLNFNQGSEKATAWGCDLTAEYVRLNSEYTT